MEERKSKNYLLIFSVTFLSALLFVSLYIDQLILSEKAPPVPFTGNKSFDEKVLQFRKSLHQVDLVVVGSSMALNNISGRVLSERFSDQNINLGVWGNKIRQSIDFYQNLESVTNPRVVLFSVGIMDFIDLLNRLILRIQYH